MAKFLKTKKFAIIFVALYIFLASVLLFLDSGTYKFDSRAQEINESLDSGETVYVYFQAREFNPVSQTLSARIFVEPPPQYAVILGSSVQVNYDTEIQFDGARLDAGKQDENWWESGEFIRGIDVELNATNELIAYTDNDKWFPFDKYSVSLNGLVDFKIAGSDTEDTNDDEWKRLPLLVKSYTSNLPGWSYEISYPSDDYYEEGGIIGNMQNGYLAMQLTLHRTSQNQAILFLIALIFIGGALSMVFLLRSILMRHRPPTLNGLVWAASTAFTMIQTRTVIPGSPRVGVIFDLLVFYPALALAFISGGLMFYSWLTRENLPQDSSN